MNFVKIQMKNPCFVRLLDIEWPKTEYMG